MQRLAEDVSDPASQKAAFTFLGRCVGIWGRSEQMTSAAQSNGDVDSQQSLPGFERFVYERLIPTAFAVPSLPAFNLKDGQMLVVSTISVCTRPGLICCLRFFMRLRAFFRLYVMSGARKHTTIFCLFSFPLKTGHLPLRWNSPPGYEI